MFRFRKKQSADEVEEPLKDSLPVVSVTLEQVKNAVEEFERNMPKGINRTILIDFQTHEINFLPLVRYLKGIPDKPFYMSRQAYEIYPEEDRMIPHWLDIVQRAVDAYIEERNKPPLIPGDSRKKINCGMLYNNFYLHELPPVDFYLTPYDNLISHRPYNPFI